MKTQIKLESDKSMMVCWVNTDDVLLNRKVKLKGFSEWWVIKEIYQTKVDKCFETVHTARFESIEMSK